MSVSDNKRIAKNTIFLYFRMLLIMFVSLYTSRVTLQALGVDDFGIYQTVGGVVTFLAFISNALGNGTSRFLTYEMGKEKPRLGELFSTVKIAHVVLGVVIVIVGEIIGLWFINNKLLIPQDRLAAARIAFHFSMVTTFFQITQVPYNAIIMAYERMNVYAYVSIAEAMLKLFVAYLLMTVLGDKLVLYAIFTGIITVMIMATYRVYCRKNFDVVKVGTGFDKGMFLSVASFSSWNLLTSSAASFANQGVTIVTNMFFSPATVTVRTLALRINNILNQFIGNFRSAVNPQIVKRFAAKEFEESKKLALVSTNFTYYLVLLVVLPLYILISPALKIWLGTVPEGLVIFSRLALIQGLFQALDSSLYVPIYAKGQIKENAIISPLCDFVQLPVIYILFKAGFPPVSLAVVETLACVLLGVVIKPILVHCVVGYGYRELYGTIVKCFLVTIVSVLIPLIVGMKLDSDTIIGFVVQGAACVMSVLFSVWIFGINADIRKFVIDYINARVKQKRIRI